MQFSQSSMLIMVLLLCTSFNAYAEIYKIVAPDGTVTFSDQPHDDAEQLTISDKPTTPNNSSTTRTSNNRQQHTEKNTKEAPEEEKQPTTYSQFSISTPSNGEAIRANDGTVQISISMSPNLATAEGHRITLVVDGKVHSKASSSTRFTLQNLSRGDHSVSATLIDEQGKTLRRASSVTFSVIRAHKNSALSPNFFPNQATNLHNHTATK